MNFLVTLRDHQRRPRLIQLRAELGRLRWHVADTEFVCFERRRLDCHISPPSRSRIVASDASSLDRAACPDVTAFQAARRVTRRAFVRSSLLPHGGGKKIMGRIDSRDREISGVAVAPFNGQARPFARITTMESLREHLQWAIELEHCTIPPYLCALYSLDAGRNPEASEVVASVFLEEMLHLALAANLLNAVGGGPRIDSPRMLPGYPRCL